jgi:P27 family predicted phage terminase small subunit
MGKRGPIPKTDEQEILEGNPSKRPLRGKSPEPRQVRPTCPSWLSPEAKQEWKRLAPEMVRLGLLTKIDRSLFAGYCSSCAWWRRAQEVLTTQGSVYVSTKGKIEPRPEVAIAKVAAEQMRSLASEFGLTPVSRARMRLPNPEPEELDPMEALLREAEKRRDNRGRW